jgi:hypothetical protein
MGGSGSNGLQNITRFLPAEPMNCRGSRFEDTGIQLVLLILHSHSLANQ